MTIGSRALKATVSGSFHRHMPAIYAAVGELRANGVDVLSPSDPTVVDHIGEFLFVASDRLRSIKMVQDRHFEAIRNSDFLWVVCPDGYTGASTSAEIGAAHMARIPVMASSPALDITLHQYVRRVRNFHEAVEIAQSAQSRCAFTPSVLIDPSHTIEKVLGALDSLRPVMLGKVGNKMDDAETGLGNVKRMLRASFDL
jgi:hypothetical protein